MKKGDLARVSKGSFKGFEGVIVKIEKCFCLGDEEFINKFGTIRVTLESYDFETITINSANIEIIDSLSKPLETTNNNYIKVSSNFGDWNKALEKYKQNPNSDIIFVEVDNYNEDDEEMAHYFMTLSIEQAIRLKYCLNEIIQYIENENKTKNEDVSDWL